MRFEWNPKCDKCRTKEQQDRCGPNNFTPDSDSQKDCAAHGAYTHSSHHIQFATMDSASYDDHELRWRNHVVHELGHAFNARLSNVVDISETPYEVLRRQQSADPAFPDRIEQDQPAYFGFHEPSDRRTWQQNKSGSYKEEFADMMIGWVFDKWETKGHKPGSPLTADGKARADFMAAHMPVWINKAAGR